VPQPERKVTRSKSFAFKPERRAESEAYPFAGGDSHRLGTWPANPSFLSSGSRAKRQPGSCASAQTLAVTSNQMRSPADLSKIVNQSGFPLQLAIDRTVQDQADRIGWSVLYREHGWKHPDGQSGFIDLALTNRYRTAVAVLECKRVQESDWIFLEPSPPRTPTLETRLWVTTTSKSAQEHFGYFDALAKPESPDCSACVVAGQDPKSRPLLERLAAELTAATEALAEEERSVAAIDGPRMRFYISVLVTTARLHHSTLDPLTVPLDTGEASSLSHQEVPWIRFRKQLASDFAVAPVHEGWNYAQLAYAKEKQIFVVHAPSLPAFLKRWDLINSSLSALAG
jgi:hypothetical protein